MPKVVTSSILALGTAALANVHTVASQRIADSNSCPVQLREPDTCGEQDWDNPAATGFLQQCVVDVTDHLGFRRLNDQAEGVCAAYDDGASGFVQMDGYALGWTDAIARGPASSSSSSIETTPPPSEVKSEVTPPPPSKVETDGNAIIKLTPEVSKDLLNRVDVILCDIQGPIFKPGSPGKLVEGIPDTLIYLKSLGKKFYLTSNIAHESREQIVQDLYGQDDSNVLKDQKLLRKKNHEKK